MTSDKEGTVDIQNMYMRLEEHCNKEKMESRVESILARFRLKRLKKSSE